ncbi:kynureninase [Jeotgalibacillus sp. R-1-5s-1]|uniref:kynureninase n=1 Tax=Jeotgalibacillus sp. R-1-5s-1 TaxID=2555897 RepID=UPI001069370A|nr:kynureninase [Jeotgalibacillus sp. R-1-5s-1]TFD97687.1 kynureninase [Jeotgalibacillus sp. R-1-5s-1]
MNYLFSVKEAEQLDQQDQLGSFKKEFYIKPDQIYLDGNSLGLLSKRAENTVLQLLDSWKNFGIEGWMEGKHPWFTLSETLGEKTAPLIGAKPHEVIVTGSITTNLHQLVSTFYHPEGNRTKIAADDLNFPSDIYTLQSQIELKGRDPEQELIKAGSEDGYVLSLSDIEKVLTDDVALLLLPSVLYRSGQLLPIKEITEMAHQKGIIVGFDLAHSIGAVPHELHDWGVDFAVWCNYKYMNNGPGGTGGLYVHEKHHDKMPGLKGWFGSDKTKQFDMEHTFTKADGAGAYQIGTPHILSTAPLIGSLELFEEAGMNRLREKSLNQTAYMISFIQKELSEEAFEIVTPLDQNQRGGHVALRHTEAASICKALKDEGVIPDFRAPDIIRLAPAAMYTSYQDVLEGLLRLKKIMHSKSYKNYENKRNVIA